MNIKIIIAYEGTNYLGWQKTDTGSSIEANLEKALEQILQEKVILQAASRTDRGVHADGQVVNFHTNKEKLNLGKLLIGINALLPPDIAVLQVEEVRPDFHATLEVSAKEYHYNICYGPVQLPEHRFYSWHFPYPLDVELMQKAATLLEGTHDFSAFTNQKKNETYENHIRTVDGIRIDTNGKERLKVTVKGKHFLYKMVRNLVGTLAYVGVGKIKLDEVKAILENKNRTLAGITAPAQGLVLHLIEYK
jgi:tRNA pseudouridine38-40 synthase